MISAKQALLARTMLDMSQQDVAAALGWAHQTVSRIENGTVNPPASRLHELQSFFESAGVDFLEGDGVRRKTKGVITYEGRDGFAKFRRDVLEQAKSGHADICVSNVDERLFDKWGAGEVNDKYRKAMAELPNTRCRFLSKEKDTYFAARDHADYRWIPDNEFGDFPLYIYGNKTAMILFDEEELYIFVLEHPRITNFYRKQFNEKWTTARIPRF